MSKILLFFSIFLLFSFSETSLKKRISDVNFRYEFYTTNKIVDPEEEKQYYWFKGGAIHNSEYGAAGELLHGEFHKFYHSNQLAESGKFKNGLKVGLWKSWFENGVLQSNVQWSDGQKDGKYFGYDQSGTLVEYGKYKNGKKHGRWISTITKDTLKYRDGKAIIKKVKVKDTIQNTKPGFIKRLFTKKDKTKDKTVSAATSIQNYKTPAPMGEAKKDNFFRRLFSKKDKTAAKGAEIKQAKVKPAATNESEGNFFTRLFAKKEKKPKANG